MPSVTARRSRPSPVDDDAVNKGSFQLKWLPSSCREPLGPSELALPKPHRAELATASARKWTLPRMDSAFFVAVILETCSWVILDDMASRVIHPMVAHAASGASWRLLLAAGSVFLAFVAPSIA